MDQKKLTKGCAIALIIYMALAVAFYLICGDQLRYRDEQTDMLSASGVIGEITSNTVVEQRIAPEGDILTGLTLYGATYERVNTGCLQLEVYDADRLLESRTVELEGMQDNALFYVPFQTKLPRDGEITLRITASDSQPGNAVTLYYGNTVQLSRGQIDAALRNEEMTVLNGEKMDGALCMRLDTRKTLWFGTYYWLFAGALLALLVLYCANLLRKNALGSPSRGLRLLSAFSRYRYLIKQLVARDFKTKYKRSALGILWSFLNPLLTMIVQYIVFSTLFRSDIPNFALYLLTGIVCFSFFSEATSMTLTSIVGNAALITKVYVPKYIYPLTRVISSTINFLLALIPLFAVMLVTHTPIRASILLLPLPVLCLFAVNLGIGMLLAASMVFFRDTQFLWGVASMLWMYATPIFYPESILPARWMPLFKCNPLYHIIRFIRIALMDGISPEPKAYALMLVASFVPLALGVWVFKRTQDRFVLNI